MQYHYPQARLLVFAKAPIAGQVKTRMQSVLSAQQCAELQQQLIEHTLNTATGSALCPVELWVTDPNHAFVTACARHYAVTVYQQHGADLGESMLHAFGETLAKTDFAVIIGCDCPVLSASHLQQMMAFLEDKISTVALIPAKDGGYVSIGLNSVITDIFRDINWGSDQVLSQTRRKIQQQQLKSIELSPLWDLDQPQDLHRLRQLPDSERWEKYICH